MLDPNLVKAVMILVIVIVALIVFAVWYSAKG